MAIRWNSFVTWMIILMAFLPPLIQSSRFSFQGEKLVMLEESSQVDNKGFLKRLRSSFETGRGVGLDSARKVPTGPDPLHHHHHPLRP